ncbi:lysozyme [Shigella dysenteriae]|uniref:Lysozyme n=1 Tax=Shigella dysenteriae TaxID=622 RepID=A0A3R0WYS6_SHIDY|nr:endolysin [Shigella dysenteriae]ELG8352051.1 lysozyme [Escherichia coli]EHX4645740.1 lysozyme [Shigella dysenteriae]EHX5640553.1 lysozyme [Shigella dysenteriae]MBA8146207.1 lysozyme [Escherichia coli]
MPKLPAPLRKKLIALVLAGAGTFTIATHYTGYWEGKENSTYIDPTGTPTICYGHIGPDVKPGMTLTDEECLELLEKDMKWAFAAIDRRVQVPLTRGQTVALASWIFWAGETNFRNSTLLRLINAGQMPASCKQYIRWIYSKGVKLPGLEARRSADEWLCRYDLPKV